MTNKFLYASVLVFASITCSFAVEPGALLKNMPSSYSGTYVWQDTRDTWYMSVSFSDRRIGANGEVEFTGKETFVHATNQSEKFESKVRAVVNARTLAFDMSEISEQPQKAGFTAMVYTGNLSSDLHTIAASWIGEKNKTVVISLTAGPR
jgi:hypothetical protein